MYRISPVYRTPTRLTIVYGYKEDLILAEANRIAYEEEKYTKEDVYYYFQLNTKWEGYERQKCIITPRFIPFPILHPQKSYRSIQSTMRFYQRLWNSEGTPNLTRGNQSPPKLLRAQHFIVCSSYPAFTWFGLNSPIYFMSHFNTIDIDCRLARESIEPSWYPTRTSNLNVCEDPRCNCISPFQLE